MIIRRTFRCWQHLRLCPCISCTGKQATLSFTQRTHVQQSNELEAEYRDPCPGLVLPCVADGREAWSPLALMAGAGGRHGARLHWQQQKEGEARSPLPTSWAVGPAGGSPHLLLAVLPTQSLPPPTVQQSNQFVTSAQSRVLQADA